jgi:hypothetical protein
MSSYWVVLLILFEDDAPVGQQTCYCFYTMDYSHTSIYYHYSSTVCPQSSPVFLAEIWHQSCTYRKMYYNLHGWFKFSTFFLKAIIPFHTIILPVTSILECPQSSPVFLADIWHQSCTNRKMYYNLHGWFKFSTFF